MVTVSRPIPAELARHTVEGLCAEHRARPWTYWLVLTGAAGALAALPLLQVEVTVRAAGLVRPATERTELKAAMGGKVRCLRARDNDRVATGQPLVELDTRDLDERRARNRALQRERSELVADLAVLTTAYADGSEKAAPGNLTTSLLMRENAEFRARSDASRLAVAKTRSDLERAEILSANGIITRRELDELRYAAERARAEAALSAQETLAAWQARLRDERTALADLVSEERRLEEEQALGVVCSPAGGTVQGLTGLAVGTYVLAGQSLGYVSPEDRLIAEVYVSPRDIAFVRAGQPARMQIDAYPHTQWGLLAGMVESVAGDATMAGHQAAFRVVVCPSALELRLADGTAGPLRKGMTLTARFVVARRSLLQLLYGDAVSRLDPQAAPVPS
jgi:membrane fusion protein, peptide pheromone/bacteriocin exporter